MSESSIRLIELLRSRIAAARRRITLTEIAFGVTVLVAIAAAFWLLATLLESTFWFKSPTRTGLLVVIGASVFGALAWWVVRPLLRWKNLLPGLSDSRIAEKVGLHFPTVEDRLTNVLQLADGKSSHATPAMVDRAVSTLGESVKDVPFETMASYDKARRFSWYASIPVLGLLAFLVAAPGSFLGASQRLLEPARDFIRPAPYSIALLPGDATITKGDDFSIRGAISGYVSAIPGSVLLELVNEDEERSQLVDLEPDSTGAIAHDLVNVRRSFRYRVYGRQATSSWHDVSVIERPGLRSLQVTLRFPRYTKLPPRTLEPNVGDFAALPGTRAVYQIGTIGNGVDTVRLEFERSDWMDLDVGQGAAEGTFTVRRTEGYQIGVVNEHGIRNDQPVNYQIELLRDESPTISILEPSASHDLSDDLSVVISARLLDDFGFSSLNLMYRLAESKYGEPSATFTSVELPQLQRDNLDHIISKPWLLTSETDLDPVPGDVIEYYLEVRDNDAWAGYKTARTAVQTLQFPSLAEQYAQLEEREDGVEDELESLLEETEQVREEFEDLKNELLRKKESDWEDQRQLQRLSDQQQGLEERIEDLSQQMDEISQQMESSDLVSQETMNSFEEMKRVMDEINSPELMEALKKLRESLQDLNLNQMQESFEAFEFNEEQYRKRLERALELFKKLRAEQNLDEASKRAEELAEEQEKLAEKLEELSENDQAEESEQDEPSDSESESGEQEAGEETDSSESETESSESETQSEDESESSESDSSSETEASESESQNESSPKSGKQEQMEALAEKQEASAEEMEELEKLIEEIQKEMEEVSNTPDEEMSELQEQMEQQDMPSQMRQNSEEMRQQNSKKAQQQQQSMSEQLQNMSQQLQNMKSQMSQEQIEINIQALRRVLDDVLTLSEEQEYLRDDLKIVSPENPTVRALAQQQRELADGLNTVADTLHKLSKDIPMMSDQVQRETGDALRAMESSISQMAERRSARAVGDQTQSMTNLNDLALLLSDLMNSMMNMQGSGAQGQMSLQQMMQQMQQMSGEQAKINSQIQKMLNDAMGNRMASDMQSRMNQMRQQQQALQKQLQEMSQNPEAKDLMGDLNKIARQMEESIQDMSRQNLNRDLIERQQQILTRLLDAQQSMQTRGRKQQREGRTGDDADRTTPADLMPDQRVNELRRDLLRALESGYSSDYRELIKRYFEALQEKQDGP